MKLSAPILLFVFLLWPAFAFGQTVNPLPPSMPRPVQSVDESQRRTKELENVENQINQSKTPVTKVNYGRQQKSRLTERDRQAIGINADDAAKFAGFLKQPATGMVRLHDISRCTETMRVLDVNAPCPQNIWGKGASFSFRRDDYFMASFSDIKYESQKLEMVGINDLGFLSNLGDVALETVDLQTAGIKALADFEPSTQYDEVVKEQKIARKGFQVGDYIYRSSLAVQLNKTYVLRSIAYQGDFYFQIGKVKKNLADLDKRKDVIVVFRLIRQYEDGSIGLLYKELQRKDAPFLTNK